MSLLKQLFLAMCLFLVVAFTGSFFAGVENSREQLLAQLRSHAQDAATALGLSMTPHVDDPAMLELMVSSVFDSGYYASIRVESIPDGKVLVERTRTLETDSVPRWFTDILQLQPAPGDALIMRGWEQAARVEVLSHPQFALSRLWESALATLGWLSACIVVSALLGGWLLRSQLRPLDRMVEQAHAISRREFNTLTEVPRTLELRRVVLAMNQMVEKLKALFAEEAARGEQLRQQAYQDSLTGLANRRQFELQLENQLAASDHNADGYLLLLRLRDLNGLNQRHGGQFADRLLQDIAGLLEQTLGLGNPNWLAARSRGGEFALLAPGLDTAQAERIASALAEGVQRISPQQDEGSEPLAHIGLATFRTGETPAVVLARADAALALAQSTAGKAWERIDGAPVSVATSQQDWRDWINEALDKNRLRLYFQPVSLCTDTNTRLHHKVLARLVNPSGETIPAGRFLPWVERFGWSARLDKAVLELCIEHIAKHHQPLAISLAPASVSDHAAMEALLERLKRSPEEARLVTFELDARHLPSSPELQLLAKEIQACGAQIALQHFGGNFSLIGNLIHLGLAYIKVDGSYVRGIDHEYDKRLFMEAIFRATRNIDLPLVAEMVESESEIQALSELGVTAIMGHVLGAPSPVIQLAPVA